MTINELATFLGWASIINVCLLFLYVIAVAFFQDRLKQLHAKLLGVSKEVLPSIYMKYFAQYKILIIFFNLVPYIVLRFVF